MRYKGGGGEVVVIVVGELKFLIQGEGSCMIYLIISKVLHTDIYTDPPTKRGLEELSLLVKGGRVNSYYFHEEVRNISNFLGTP